VSEKGTEQATEQRKQKARDKGDTVQSRELISAAAMLTGVLVLGISTKQFLLSWARTFAQTLTLGTRDLQGSSRVTLMNDAMRILLPSLLPAGQVLMASFCAALLAGTGQLGGLKIHVESLAPKWGRLNPVTNLKNIFSVRSLTRLAKSLIPAAIVVALGVNSLRTFVLPMPVMSVMRLPTSFSVSLRLATDAACIMVVWALFDYALERRSWNRKLRMTKQELRDELKDSMGNPQVKGRIRQIQNAMRRRKVRADVSRASVVITNPTHYAVALEFSFDSMLAPTVLLKGRNLHAQRIREEARWAGIPMVENPPLARSLYKNVQEGQSIPYELYAAVAGILAFLYRQKVEEAAKERNTANDSTKAMAPSGLSESRV
jgi:flagellar biosynthesis protein FlhB